MNSVTTSSSVLLNYLSTKSGKHRSGFGKQSDNWIAPHRVKKNDKFYGRNSTGKYPLDVSELRTAFTLSEQISERIRNFRIERIAAVAGNEALVGLSENQNSCVPGLT